MAETTEGTGWYETPTGMMVPIPPISGGSDAAGGPPAAPALAPADSAPAPVSRCARG